MKKTVISIMAALCVVLLIFSVLLSGKEDNSAPVISLPDAQCSYTEGDSTDPLLEGLSAYDEQDGDVTSSIRVEAIRPLKGGAEAAVVYVAKDQSNNIASAKRIVEYISQDAESANPLPASAAAKEPEAVRETETPEAAADAEEASEEPVGGVSAEDAAAAAQEAQEAFADLPENCPRLTMAAAEVTISAGSGFAPLDYISDITDDVDTRDELYRRIQIYGDYNENVPGTYELTYYVTDRDQNQSNVAVLTLTVTE